MPESPAGPHLPGWYGLPRRRRRSGLSGLVAPLVVAAVALVLAGPVAGWLGGPGGTGSVTGGSPTSAPSASTTATATAHPPPTAGAPSATPRPKRDAPNRSLTRNSLYAVDLSNVRVTCGVKVRSPKPPVRNADLAPYLRSLTKCLVKVHRSPLAAKGFTVTEPKIRVYRSAVSSPCGRFDQKGAPAYYCSVDRTIYWPATRDDGREAYTFARLGYIALLAHEFGHHLQAVTGMLDDYGRLYASARSASDRYTLSRRLELQAQCFEGVFLQTVARSLELSAQDRNELRRWHSFTGDEDPPKSRKPDHGSSAAQFRWLVRGLSQDYDRCNTWAAPRSAVR